MFPITCNSFGDIVAVVQLVRDIIRALDDARGAVEEYTRFVDVLTSLGTVMEEVYYLAKDARREALRQAVLDEVGRVCKDISSATDHIGGFEKLAEASARSTRNRGGGTYPQEVFTKLRWRFQKASDADRYAKRFGESLHRLNAFIGILGHQSTTQLFTQQQYQTLRMAHSQNRAIRESTDEIKAFTLSAIHQVSMQSRQQVTEQALALPFFSWASQDRRVVASVKRVADTIFDYVAPHTEVAQRERFLAILAPFAMTSAAFAIYTNMDPRWRIASLWATVVALVVEVLWLRSCMPTYAGFGCDNAVILIDALGDRIVVPFQFCGSPEMFHDFLLFFYTSTRRNVADFVENRLYELYLGESSRLISWGDSGLGCVRPGSCIEMGIILVNEIESKLEDPGLSSACPYCESENSVDDSSSEVVCSCCSRDYRETRECIPVVRVASVMGGVTWLRRGVDESDDEEDTGKDFAMELRFCNSITNHQFFVHDDCHIGPSTMQRIPRIRVINLEVGKTCLPEDIQWGVQALATAIISDHDPIAGSNFSRDLLTSYLNVVGAIEWDDLGMSCIPSLKRVYDYVYAHYGVQAMSDPFGGKSVMGPTTPTEQLLANMVSAVDDFIAEPSRKGVHRWDEIIGSYSSDNMPPVEAGWFDKLEESHGDISSVFESICEHLGLPDDDDSGSDSD